MSASNEFFRKLADAGFITRKEADFATWQHDTLARYAAEVTAMFLNADEQDKDLIDAQRYRKLRAQFWTDNTLTVVHPGSVLLGCRTLSGEMLDKAVDALPEAPK